MWWCCLAATWAALQAGRGCVVAPSWDGRPLRPPRTSVARARAARLQVAVNPADTAPADEQQATQLQRTLLRRANALLEALPEEGTTLPAYSAVLRAFSEAGAPEDCLRLLRRMRRSQVRPSLECYSFVVSALQAAGRTREAARWMRRVVQPELSDSLLQRAVSEGEVVTRERYNRVLASYAAAGRPAEAVRAMKQMVSLGGVTPDIVSFNCLIGAHAMAGDPDRALSWLQRACNWGLTPDVVTYTTVIAGYARACEPDRAREVLETMTAAGVAPNVLSYSALVDAFAVAGRVAEASQWLRTASEGAGLEIQRPSRRAALLEPSHRSLSLSLSARRHRAAAQCCSGWCFARSLPYTAPCARR